MKIRLVHYDELTGSFAVAQTIIYRCDVCKKVIEDLHGPLCLTAYAPNMSEIEYSADVCDIKCARVWLESVPEKFS
jgi:hypothetical protein